MKNRFTLILSAIILTFISSCDKKDIRFDNFFVEFATVKNEGATTTFQIDNGSVLIPKEKPTLNFEDGNRVILNYTPLEGGLIFINSVRPIFVDNIKEIGYPDEIDNSPIKIISVWVSGGYLNMSFQVDYHSKPHATSLFSDPETVKPTLYFSYSRKDDPPGAPTLTYLSFKLDNLEEKGFTMYINTYEGLRKFEFQKN